MTDSKQLKAIATTYDGIVFRSRLEAIFYRYWQLQVIKHPKNTWVLEYEPPNYSNDVWTPDLYLKYATPGYSDPTKALIEIKPTTDRFRYDKYLPHFQLFNIDLILLCEPSLIVSFSKSGTLEVGCPDELLFKQASNDVYRHVKPNG